MLSLYTLPSILGRWKVLLLALLLSGMSIWGRLCPRNPILWTIFCCSMRQRIRRSSSIISTSRTAIIRNPKKSASRVRKDWNCPIVLLQLPSVPMPIYSIALSLISKGWSMSPCRSIIKSISCLARFRYWRPNPNSIV